MFLDRSSKAIDLQAISSLLININRDLVDNWPIVPKENLKAQKKFLLDVIKFKELNPKLSVEESILKVKEDYKQRGALKKVIKMPPNISILKLSIFRVFPTLTGDLIDKAATIQTAKEAVQVPRKSKPTETTPLLGDTTAKPKRY